MKIRNGFVSNSSSSSFVLCHNGYDDEVKTLGDFVQFIFTELEEYAKKAIESRLWGNESYDEVKNAILMSCNCSAYQLCSTVVRDGMKYDTVTKYKHFDVSNHRCECYVEWFLELFINYYQTMSWSKLGTEKIDDSFNSGGWEFKYLGYNG